MAHFVLILIYFAFVGLGLPDALLGAGWPVMSGQFQVPVSYMGAISLLISGFTVISSLLTDRLVSRFGTGRVTAFCLALSTAALFGFAASSSWWELCLWAVPYGLGAGSIDAGLNDYAAKHYASRHMSWLHCMWGVGAAVGPYVMGYVLTGGRTWNAGYLVIAVLLALLTAIVFLSIPKWKTSEKPMEKNRKPLSFGQVIAIPGVKETLLIFLCYGAVESITGHWASSYLVLNLGVGEERAASLAAMFYLGITAGRGVSGFITMRFSDKQMGYTGMAAVLAGILLILVSRTEDTALAGFVIMGVGCAPIFPCLIHVTPERFGASRSQAVIGVEMASFYAGTCFLPPLFGLVADWLGLGAMPPVLLGFLALMLGLHIRFYKITEAHEGKTTKA